MRRSRPGACNSFFPAVGWRAFYRQPGNDGEVALWSRRRRKRTWDAGRSSSRDSLSRIGYAKARKFNTSQIESGARASIRCCAALSAGQAVSCSDNHERSWSSMLDTTEIADGIFRISIWDEKDLIEAGIFWPGVSYNLFVVRDQKSAIVQTMYRKTFARLRERVAQVVDPAELSYIVVPHHEGDSS